MSRGLNIMTCPKKGGFMEDIQSWFLRCNRCLLNKLLLYYDSLIQFEQTEQSGANEDLQRLLNSTRERFVEEESSFRREITLRQDAVEEVLHTRRLNKVNKLANPLRRIVNHPT